MLTRRPLHRRDEIGCGHGGDHDVALPDLVDIGRAVNDPDDPRRDSRARTGA